MNRAELIDDVAKLTRLPEKKVARAIKALFEEIARAGRQGTKVRIEGFGVFALKRYEPKQNNSALAAASPPIKARRKSKVVFKFSREAVAELNRQSFQFDNKQIEIGGNLEMAEENQAANHDTPASESSSFGLDVGTSRLVLASGS